MRFFNTDGPVRPEDHHTLPPLQRWDLDDVLRLIDQKKYFLLHAPRQTGKTTCLLALVDYLNREGRYRAVYANIEPAQAARENVSMGMTAVVEQIARGARDQVNDRQATDLAETLIAWSSGTTLVEEFLTRWQAESQPTDRFPELLVSTKPAAAGGNAQWIIRISGLSVSERIRFLGWHRLRSR